MNENQPTDRLSRQLGRRVQLRRTSLGLSAGELAERLGWAPDTLRRVECGLLSLKVDQLVDLARALDTPATWLLGEITPVAANAAHPWPPDLERLIAEYLFEQADGRLMDIYKALDPTSQAKLLAMTARLFVEASVSGSDLLRRPPAAEPPRLTP